MDSSYGWKVKMKKSNTQWSHQALQTPKIGVKDGADISLTITLLQKWERFL
jgi:hypothetical protein